MRLKLCGAVVAVALAVAGCGGSGSKTSTSRQTARATTTRTTPDLSRSTNVFFVNRYPKPRNPGPHPGARVDQLIVRDVHIGTGPVIHAGDHGFFEFIATDWVTGRPIEEAWHRRAFETQIEHNVVIDGWWQGIPGMRVGGERQIIIPPSLGFTTNPSMANATTYFDVVLNAVVPQRPNGMSSGGTGAGSTSNAFG